MGGSMRILLGGGNQKNGAMMTEGKVNGEGRVGFRIRE